jgi:hypothetical protein
MLKAKIFTNNPLVRDKYPDLAEFLDTGPEGVLIAVRDRVHLGAGVLNHPLSGDVLPGISPYKSIIVTGTKRDGSIRTDFESLGLIERAIGAIKEPPAGFKGHDMKTLEDFQVLDLDLLDSALAASPQLKVESGKWKV